MFNWFKKKDKVVPSITYRNMEIHPRVISEVDNFKEALESGRMMPEHYTYCSEGSHSFSFRDMGTGNLYTFSVHVLGSPFE